MSPFSSILLMGLGGMHPPEGCPSTVLLQRSDHLPVQLLELLELQGLVCGVCYKWQVQWPAAQAAPLVQAQLKEMLALLLARLPVHKEASTQSSPMIAHFQQQSQNQVRHMWELGRNVADPTWHRTGSECRSAQNQGRNHAHCCEFYVYVLSCDIEPYRIGEQV